MDNFAHHRNTQLPRFHSRFWCPGSEAVDTFSTSWEGEMNWVVPPLSQVDTACQGVQSKGLFANPSLGVCLFLATHCSGRAAFSRFHSFLVLASRHAVIWP